MQKQIDPLEAIFLPYLTDHLFPDLVLLRYSCSGTRAPPADVPSTDDIHVQQPLDACWYSQEMNRPIQTLASWTRSAEFDVMGRFKYASYPTVASRSF